MKTAQVANQSKTCTHTATAVKEQKRKGVVQTAAYSSPLELTALSTLLKSRCCFFSTNCHFSVYISILIRAHMHKQTYKQAPTNLWLNWAPSFSLAANRDAVARVKSGKNKRSIFIFIGSRRHHISCVTNTHTHTNTKTLRALLTKHTTTVCSNQCRKVFHHLLLHRDTTEILK